MIEIAYDFHIHSCLSPCGDEDMTPNNIAGMAFLNGLGAIAVSDHNSVKNCDSLKEAAKQYGIVTLYGMELTTVEEVHTLCLFADRDAAMEWDGYVYSHLIKIKNNPKIFGRQLLIDSEDNIIGEEENLLINATDIPFDGVFSPIEFLGGVALPAHIDKASNSLIANLGFVPPNPGFDLVELNDINKAEKLMSEHPYFKKCGIISNSDAHYLHDINMDKNRLTVEELTSHTVLDALKNLKPNF